jgi:hypothetical protein
MMKIKAIWYILTCKGYWLVYTKKSRRYMSCDKISIADLLIIAEDATETLSNILTERQQEANVNAAKTNITT